MLDRPNLDFSFSGLKTAAITRWKAFDGTDSERQLFMADLAASFELAVVDVLIGKSVKALGKSGPQFSTPGWNFVPTMGP